MKHKSDMCLYIISVNRMGCCRKKDIQGESWTDLPVSTDDFDTLWLQNCKYIPLLTLVLNGACLEHHKNK